MTTVKKSDLLKYLKNNYVGFLSKDLEKFLNVILSEIKQALKRGERVEIRNFGIFFTNIQKASIRRNPRTGEKVAVKTKRTVRFKMGKEMFKKLNNNE